MKIKIYINQNNCNYFLLILQNVVFVLFLKYKKYKIFFWHGFC